MKKLRLSQTVASIETLIQECKNSIETTIKDNSIKNDKLKPIGECCFTISFSDLSKDCVLSPKYYDFSWQFDLIIKKLRKQGIEAFMNTVQKIIETGKCDGERFHPDVIAVLKELI